MRNRSAWLASIAGLVLATVLTGLLGYQNRGLRAAVAEQRQRIVSPYPGLQLPGFTGSTLDGHTVVIGRGASAPLQVLFVFNTTCAFCLRTLPAWRQIASELAGEGSHADVYGITMHPEPETEAYIDRHQLSFPVLFLPDSLLRYAYRIDRVPLTMVLDSSGVVRYSHVGELALRSREIDSVLRAVRSRLNGQVEPGA